MNNFYGKHLHGFIFKNDIPYALFQNQLHKIDGVSVIMYKLCGNYHLFYYFDEHNNVKKCTVICEKYVKSIDVEINLIDMVYHDSNWYLLDENHDLYRNKLFFRNNVKRVDNVFETNLLAVHCVNNDLIIYKSLKKYCHLRNVSKYFTYPNLMILRENKLIVFDDNCEIVDEFENQVYGKISQFFHANDVMFVSENKLYKFDMVNYELIEELGNVLFLNGNMIIFYDMKHNGIKLLSSKWKIYTIENIEDFSCFPISRLY